MNAAICIRCGRSIVYAKRSDTHEPIALEKIYPYKIDLSEIGSTAYSVEAVGNEDLFVAHSKVCPKKETA